MTLSISEIKNKLVQAVGHFQYRGLHFPLNDQNMADAIVYRKLKNLGKMDESEYFETILKSDLFLEKQRELVALFGEKL